MPVAHFHRNVFSSQIVRFILVGLINTTVDVLLFTGFRFAGLPIVIANILSTSVALTVSLTLNYRYTFSGKALTLRRILLYIVVTLSALWVLQPLIITLLTAWDSQSHFIEALTGFLGHPALFVILVPKLVSIVFTLVWNYLWYSRVVFATPKGAAVS